jgi:hypothetical protein
MAQYLRKYVGTYRVKAEYDLSTNDFPRLENGSLDPSFDDLYIDCKNNIQIKHGVGSVLWCYIPSKPRGLNILRQIYKDKISKTLPKEKGHYFENLCSELVKKEVLVSAEVLDFEVCFEFKADTIDYIAQLVGARKYGASISPFSSKNLPKESCKIPDKDMKLYKEAIKDFPTVTRTLHDKPTEIPDAVLINKLNKEFDQVIVKSQPKGFDIKQDKKKKGLKVKEYIYSMGMWQEYCEFLKTKGESVK